MASPTFKWAANSTETGAQTSWTVTPGTLVDGDRMIAVQTLDYVTTVPVLKSPAGWVRRWVGPMRDSSGAVGWAGIYEKEADTESGTYTFTSSVSDDGGVAMVCYDGDVITGDDLAIIAISSACDADTASPTVPKVYSPEDDVTAIAISVSDDAGSYGSVTAPSGYTLRDSGDLGGTFGTGRAIADKAVASAGDIAAADFGSAGSTHDDATIHLVLASAKTNTLPQIRSNSFTRVNFGSTVNANLPPNIRVGDGLLMQVSVDAGDPVTTPTGWTLEVDLDSGTAIGGGIYSRVATAGDVTTDEGDATITVALNSATDEYTVDIWAMDKDTIDSTDFVEVLGTQETGTATSVAVDAITTLTAKSLAMAFANFDDDDISSAGAFVPTEAGWNHFKTPHEVGSSGPTNFMAYKYVASTGTSGDCTFTVSASEEYSAVQIAIKPAAGGASAQNIAVGLASASTSAFAITAVPGALSQAVGLATGSASAFAIGIDAAISQAVGLVTATGSAFAITAVPGTANIPVGLANATSSVFAITPATTLTQAVGLASGSSSAFAIVVSQGVNIAVGLATATGSAFSIGIDSPLSQAVGLATGTATAFTITIDSPTTIPVGLASVSASAFDITAVPGTATIPVGLASATASAFPIVAAPGTVTIPVGLATATATALGMTVAQGQSIPVGLASATASAFEIVAVPGVANIPVGLAEGTASAFIVDINSPISVALGLAEGTATAFDIVNSPGQTIPVGLAEGTATAFDITIVGGDIVISATDDETGYPVIYLMRRKRHRLRKLPR